MAGDVNSIAYFALEHFRAGRLAEAERLYRQVIEQRPDDADVWNLLGALAHQRGDHREALELIGRAIRLMPRVAVYHNNRARVLLVEGNLPEAESSYREAVRLDADYHDARHGLATCLRRQGRVEEALAEYRALLSRNADAAAYNEAGVLLAMSGRRDEAIENYRQALSLWPDYPEAHLNLANVLRETGRTEDAIRHLRRAVGSRADFPEAWNNLGNILKETGQLQEARDAYLRAIAVRKDYADAHFNLGIALHALGMMDDSAATIERAIQLGLAQGAAGGTLAAGYNNLGNALKSIGRLEDAIKAYRQSVACAPNSLAQVNLMQAVSFHPDYTARDIHEYGLAWDRLFARPLAPAVTRFQNDRDPHRRLRIGYVSPDFRDHCQSMFTLPLLSHHDRARFEIFCYSNLGNPDALTERIRGHCDHWCDISILSDDAAAGQIRQDRIDILIDLAMHMERNRILIFARRPAPVQATWLAYPGTTGLSAMDWRISDPHLDPGDDDAFYTEKTVRLPHSFWCYDPLTSDPEPSPPPALDSGTVTFGCLNNFTKVTDRTLELWSAVLRAVPGSRLRLLAPPGSARRSVVERLGAMKVGQERIDFVDRQARPIYLREFHRIDICLDPFPCPGHTTTLDALWMGVPVVNLPGATAVARGGKSILTNLGHPEWIARAPEDFVRIALRLVSDLKQLASLRRNLRQQMQSSVLMDAPAFTAAMEQALARTWQAWCDSSAV